MSVRNLGVGGSIPVVFTLGAELFPTRIRGTMVSVIARCRDSVANRKGVVAQYGVVILPLLARECVAVRVRLYFCTAACYTCSSVGRPQRLS